MSTHEAAGEFPRRGRQFEFSALTTLFVLSLRQFLRGNRVIILLLLSLLPAGLVVLIRCVEDRPPSGNELVYLALFVLIPHTVLPLTALLYGTGIIRDEQEDQTLTYLLIRPLPKQALYLTKLLAAMCMVAVLGAIYVIIGYLAAYAGSGEFLAALPALAKTYGIMALTLATYTAMFACLGLLVNRSLIIGIIYIVLLEFLAGRFDWPLRKLAVLYYFRVLAVNWLDLPSGKQDWSIQPEAAPAVWVCLAVLAGVTIVSTLIAARYFAEGEYHVKTPEAS